MRLDLPALLRWNYSGKLAICLCLVGSGCENEQDLAPDKSSDGGTQMQPPETKACSEDGKWHEVEFEVLKLVNEVRAKGAVCGSRGAFGPAPALKADARLRCAARLHSQDMVDRKYFEHDNPDGEGPLDRIKKTGYSGRLVGENIAAGQSSASAVMAGWMKSPGHCANIMKAEYTELGVGYVHGSDTKYKHYWTQNFGASK